MFDQTYLRNARPNKQKNVFIYYPLFSVSLYYSLSKEEGGGGGHTTIIMENEKRMRREIANSNERRRMQSINAGFQSLRSLLPHHEGEKLSKVCYISFSFIWFNEYIIRMPYFDIRRINNHYF